jgi:hypothetical protein
MVFFSKMWGRFISLMACYFDYMHDVCVWCLINKSCGIR